MVAPLRLLWWLSGWDWGRDGVREIANEKDELPALVVGEFPFVGRHRLVALRNDVEKLAVGHIFEAGGIGEVGRARVIHFGLRAISLPCLAVTFGAFVEKNRADLFRPSGGVEGKWVF